MQNVNSGKKQRYPTVVQILSCPPKKHVREPLRLDAPEDMHRDVRCSCDSGGEEDISRHHGCIYFKTAFAEPFHTVLGRGHIYS